MENIGKNSLGVSVRAQCWVFGGWRHRAGSWRRRFRPITFYFLKQLSPTSRAAWALDCSGNSWSGECYNPELNATSQKIIGKAVSSPCEALFASIAVCNFLYLGCVGFYLFRLFPSLRMLSSPSPQLFLPLRAAESSGFWLLKP